MKRMKISRKTRSTMFANIILFNGLVPEFQAYRYSHPKIKSDFRLANLFLLNKKLRWCVPDKVIEDVNMSNMIDYYYDDSQWFDELSLNSPFSTKGF